MNMNCPCRSRVLLLITWMCLCFLLQMSSTVNVEEHIHRLRRSSEHDEVDLADVHISYKDSSEYTRLTLNETALKVLPRRHESLRLKLNLNSSGHAFHLHLRPAGLVFHGAHVNIRYKDREERMMMEDTGCHYEGNFDGHTGLASVHFCHGVLVGSAQHPDFDYNIHPHPFDYTDDETEATLHYPDDYDDWLGTGRVVVTWSKRSQPSDNTTLHHKRKKRALDPKAIGNDKDEEFISKLNPPDNKYYTREKPLFAEWAIVVDHFYLETLADKFRYTTNEQRLRLIILKLVGVVTDVVARFIGQLRNMQPYKYPRPKMTSFNPFTARVHALYHKDYSGYNFTMQVKRIDLWLDDPKWYIENPKYRKLGKGCWVCINWYKYNPEVEDYDAILVLTSKIEGKEGRSGVSPIEGVCTRLSKCFTTQSTRANWQIEAHEFGHLVSFKHDDDMYKAHFCQKTFDNGDKKVGFMGGNNYAFIDCYRYKLHWHLRKKETECLYEVNVPHVGERRQYVPSYPVAVLGMDYFCQLILHRHSVYLPYETPECSIPRCAVVDETKRDFGLMGYKYRIGLWGTPCGPNGDHICVKLSFGADWTCTDPKTIPHRTTIRSVPVKYRIKGQGTWGAWGAWSDQCSSPCGTGVFGRKRICSNPFRSVACFPGRGFSAVLCNEQPCAGEADLSFEDLQENRAIYVCSALNKKGTLTASGTLDTASFNGIGHYLTKKSNRYSCAVYCHQPDLPEGEWKVRAFAPDGSPCGRGISDLFEHVFLGWQYKCLRGVCVKFGCDNQTEDGRGLATNDACGVCKGDNSTCGTYGAVTIPMAAKAKKVPVKTMKTGTTNIRFGFSWESKDVSIVLADKDDELVIDRLKSAKRIDDNRKEPAYFAGTYWTYVLEGAVITAPGPINMPMKIKLSNKNSKKDYSVTVYYHYKEPATVPVPSSCPSRATPDPVLGGCKCSRGKEMTVSREREEQTRGLGGNPEYHSADCKKSCVSTCHVLLYPDSRPRDCTCQCREREVSGQFGLCYCELAYSGINCIECAFKCYNGGSQTSNCLCQCPSGCAGKDCSDCNYDTNIPQYKGHYRNIYMSNFSDY